MIGALLAVVLSSSVISVPKGDLYDEDPVVTNVDLSGIGEARSLPKYLHERSFDDSYPDDAEAYYRSRSGGAGGCSAVRDGGFLYRNFDYPFDERAEFVVRMGAGAGRFASVGVAQVGTNLTERMVTSGRWSKWYKALPGATVDGINECGVAVTVNVTDDVPSWHSTGSLHPLGAVRWILDHATNAQHGAEYIAANIKFPQGWTQNFHYMVADAEKTYFVENGTAYDAYDGYFVPVDEPAVMTNFRLSEIPWEGMGRERFSFLMGRASITNAWYTRAYRRETNPPWVSDLAEIIDYTNEIFNAWATHDKEYFRGKTNSGGQTWWQTVHTSIYDITNKTLRIAVQETDDWYTFAVPSAGGVKPEAVREIVSPMIGAATNGLRRVDDMAVYESVPVIPSEFLPISGGSYDWSSYRLWHDFEQGLFDYYTLIDARGSRAGTFEYDGIRWVWLAGDFLLFNGKDPVSGSSPYLEYSIVTNGDRLATMNGVNAAIAAATNAMEATGTDMQIVRNTSFRTWNINVSFADSAGQAGNANSAPWGGITDTPTTLSGYGITDGATKAELAAKRDLADNRCAKTEFTEWTFTGDPIAVDILRNGTIIYIEYDSFHWQLSQPLPDPYVTAGVSAEKDATKLEWDFLEPPYDEEHTYHATATRTSVCTSNELYVTQGYVDAKNPGDYAAVSNAAMSAISQVTNADANLIFTITSDGAEPRFYFTPVGAIDPED